MKTITFHIDDELRTAYKKLADTPLAQEYLKTIRENAGYSELLRMALTEHLEILQQQFME